MIESSGPHTAPTYADFEIAYSSSGVTLAETAHVLIPGRGRDSTGYGLSQATKDRLATATQLYNAHLSERRQQNFDGMIVTSGYKTPGDRNGNMETLLDTANNRWHTYRGYPEAYSGRLLLMHEFGVPGSLISGEINSIDSATNLVRTEQECHFDRNKISNPSGKHDDRPVAIVAQSAHLARIVECIAPKTLARDFVAVIVPETGEVDEDSNFGRRFSRAVTIGLHPDTPFAIARTHVSASILWQAALIAQRLMNPSQASAYYTDSSE